MLVIKRGALVRSDFLEHCRVEPRPRSQLCVRELVTEASIMFLPVVIRSYL